MTENKVVEFNEREPSEQKPSVEVKSISLDCSSCGEKLLTVKKAKEAPTPVKIRALCCFCGDKTFYKEVSGAFYLSAEPNVYLNDVREEAEDQHFLVETKEKNDG